MKRLPLHPIIAWILLTILGLIVFHAPLTVFIESHWSVIGDYSKAWKEVMVLVALLLVAIDYTRRRKWSLLERDVVIWIAGGYAVLHIVSMMLFPQHILSMIAGLMIDLRYVAYFVVVYGFLKLYPMYRSSFQKLALLGAILVIGFAVLQLALPHDFLKHIGYGDATIQPYLTVDKNPDYVRLQSTMRGPNPLGAYAVMVLAGVAAYGATTMKYLRPRKERLLQNLLAAGGLLALWFSYSRSAILGLGVVFVMMAWIMRAHISRQQKIITGVGIVLLLVLGVGLLQGTSFWHNVVIHDNPSTGARIDSNQGHADSLRDGLERMATQPLGAGIGSTGSASLYGTAPLIIENQYLFIAHEVGWMGLIVFFTLTYRILQQLWRQRQDWRSLALVTSGFALLVIGLLQPVWVDDTVSMVWWGLAGVFYGAKGGDNGTTTDKKAKRTT